MEWLDIVMNAAELVFYAAVIILLVRRWPK